MSPLIFDYTIDNIINTIIGIDNNDTPIILPEAGNSFILIIDVKDNTMYNMNPNPINIKNILFIFYLLYHHCYFRHLQCASLYRSPQCCIAI